MAKQPKKGSGSSRSSGSGSSDARRSRKPKTSGSGSGSKGRSGRGSSNTSRQGSKPGKKRQYTATTRSVQAQRSQPRKRRRDLKGAAVNLPNWVIEGVERVTPADRVAPTLEALGAASEALGDGRYQSAVKHAQRAKALSPQDPTIRETLGLAAYRSGDWSTALSELRAYRRMQGDTTHLPVEMDVLRAMNRPSDVEKAWSELQRRGGHGLVMNEGTVVYGSFLLDEGRLEEAWDVVAPDRIERDPNEAHLRRYFVAARVAAALGDGATARRLADAIVTNDPAFPGYDSLEAEIARVT